ncbi:hypothetical protein CCP2SC5_260002 [Azospirillaceae bacterium]
MRRRFQRRLDFEVVVGFSGSVAMSARKPGRNWTLFLAVAVFLVSVMASGRGEAQSPLSHPVLDQLSSPFTESEIGAMGCLAANMVTGVVLVNLMGGVGEIALALQGPLPPSRILEAAAASSFVFSSVCYIGQATAPLVVLAADIVGDWFERMTGDLSQTVVGHSRASTSGGRFSGLKPSSIENVLD